MTCWEIVLLVVLVIGSIAKGVGFYMLFSGLDRLGALEEERGRR